MDRRERIENTLSGRRRRPGFIIQIETRWYLRAFVRDEDSSRSPPLSDRRHQKSISLDRTIHATSRKKETDGHVFLFRIPSSSLLWPFNVHCHSFSDVLMHQFIQISLSPF